MSQPRKRWKASTASTFGFLRRVVPSLKLTAKAPENRPGPKRKQSYSNHPFSGANLLLVSERWYFW